MNNKVLALHCYNRLRAYIYEDGAELSAEVQL